MVFEELIITLELCFKICIFNHPYLCFSLIYFHWCITLWTMRHKFAWYFHIRLCFNHLSDSCIISICFCVTMLAETYRDDAAIRQMVKAQSNMEVPRELMPHSCIISIRFCVTMLATLPKNIFSLNMK